MYIHQKKIIIISTKSINNKIKKYLHFIIDANPPIQVLHRKLINLNDKLF